MMAGILGCLFMVWFARPMSLEQIEEKREWIARAKAEKYKEWLKNEQS